MKRYYVPNILSEAEFDDLRKKADTGDAVAPSGIPCLRYRP